MSAVLLAWQATNAFGWGIAGLNIFCHWAVSGRVHPHMLRPIVESDLAALDPLRRLRIAGRVDESNAFARRMAAVGEGSVRLSIPVVHPLGNRYVGKHDRIRGSRNIGRLVFEETRLEDWPDVTGLFDAVVCASRWNAELVQAKLGREVVVIHEGVDPSLFHPAPRSGLLDANRFYIFSGGKIEFRKAQDLVLLAFKIFSALHDDAVLVTSWHNPWPQYAAGFQGRLGVPIEIGPDERLAIGKWIVDNGVDPAKVIVIGPTPNQLMPQVLREMDCALQPSRAEGGTNFVAMEAMACGVPVIVSDNTGVRDIADESHCVPLIHQGPVEHPTDRGAEGWGESDVEKIVAALERLYQSRDLRQRIGAAAAEFMRFRTWAKHAG